MKFITEEYLRGLYKKESFTVFKLEEGQRLTPGAKEYLASKGIRMQEEVVKEDKHKAIEEKVCKENIYEENVCKEKVYKEKRKDTQKLYYKLKLAEATFMNLSFDLLEFYEEDDETRNKIMNKMDSINKILSQMVNIAATGGNTWQTEE